MCGDNEQESASGDFGGVGNCQAVVAQLLTSLSSEEVYAASARCLPGAKEFLKTD